MTYLLKILVKIYRVLGFAKYKGDSENAHALLKKNNLIVKIIY